jgi:hypothetical protein
MRRLATTIVALGFVALAPTGLVAQDLAGICASLADVEVGEWAVYEVDSDAQQSTMRFALIPEGAAGGDGQWFELSMNVNGQDMILQLLVPDWPFGPSDVQGIVMKAAGQPAMRIPDSMLSIIQGQMDFPVSDISESCAGSELLGTESVEVPAGTFDALRLRPADQNPGTGDVWVSEDVPFGLVKFEGPDGSMMLIDSGNGATSTITETPQDIPGMPGLGGP